VKIPTSTSRQDAMAVAAIIVFLLLGATGSAKVMFAMSLVSLVLMTALYRKRFGAAVLVAVSVAAVTAFSIARFLSG
jgi:hypothetical protein